MGYPKGPRWMTLSEPEAMRAPRTSMPCCVGASGVLLSHIAAGHLFLQHEDSVGPWKTLGLVLGLLDLFFGNQSLVTKTFLQDWQIDLDDLQVQRIPSGKLT